MQQVILAEALADWLKKSTLTPIKFWWFHFESYCRGSPRSPHFCPGASTPHDQRQAAFGVGCAASLSWPCFGVAPGNTSIS